MLPYHSTQHTHMHYTQHYLCHPGLAFLACIMIAQAMYRHIDASVSLHTAYTHALHTTLPLPPRSCLLGMYYDSASHVPAYRCFRITPHSIHTCTTHNTTSATPVLPSWHVLR